MHEPPAQPPSPSQSTVWLLVSGGGLIVMAVLTLIFSSWQEFTPMARVLLTAVPLLALYGIGLATARQPEQEAVSNYTVLTANIIFPFVLGVFLWQTGIYRTGSAVTDTFVALTASLSVPWLVAMELLWKRSETALITLASAIVAMFSLLSAYSADAVSVAATLLGCGSVLMLLSRGYARLRDGGEWQASIYGYGGAFLFWIGAFMLPAVGGGSELAICLRYAAFAPAFFLMAVLASYEWRRLGDGFAYSLRVLSEKSAAATLLLPLGVVSLWSDNATAIALCALAGAMALGISSVVRVSEFRILGATALAISLLRIIGGALEGLAAVWPVLMLATGFLLIGLAWLIHRYDYRSAWAAAWKEPETSLFGLGEDPKPIASDVAPISSQAKDTDRARWWSNLLIFLGFLVLLQVLAGIATS